MDRRITIIQGHPDPQPDHFGHVLAGAYASGAEQAGHACQRVDVAALDFPVLRRKEDFETGIPPESIRQAQDAIRWADHLLIIFPLWHGTMPALLKAFFEQVFRPGFALAYEEGRLPKKLLTGRSARVVVTMGMPAFFYRLYFGAHGLKSLTRSILGASGIGPIRESLVGTVEGMDDAKRARWIDKMRRLGADGT